MNITLMHGDCLEKMAEIADGSVDMVLADPPYGTTACKWDSIIPLEPMWEHLKRVIKPNGAIIITSSQPFSSALVMSNVRMFKYDWVWRKPKGTGHLNAKKMPMNNYENISVFYKSQPTYNPQWTFSKPYTSAKSGKVNKVASTEVSNKHFDGPSYRNGSDGRRYPTRVQEFGVVERGTVHPTQKPVALMEYLIKTYTNEGETVLDFTMGSGTTGVACKSLNRSFIGIEKDDSYFEVASNRISLA
jgi:site-specific DNA-methyltransferase (adenine-specific)